MQLREGDKMKSKKRKKLEKAGWRIGSATDFLALTPAEESELDRRLKAHAKNPANVVPWETVKADLDKKYGKP
jgi:putative addiction module component (TIGR02574 family)